MYCVLARKPCRCGLGVACLGLGLLLAEEALGRCRGGKAVAVGLAVVGGHAVGEILHRRHKHNEEPVLVTGGQIMLGRIQRGEVHVGV